MKSDLFLYEKMKSLLWLKPDSLTNNTQEKSLLMCFVGVALCWSVIFVHQFVAARDPQEKDNQRSRGLQGMVREFERLAFLGLNGWVVNVGEILKLNMGLPWVCLRCIFPMGDPPFGESIGFNMVWAIYTDLTGTETWNHGQWDGSSQKWPYFWLVNYCNLPRHGV